MLKIKFNLEKEKKITGSPVLLWPIKLILIPALIRSVVTAAVPDTC